MGWLFAFGFAVLSMFVLYRSGRCSRMALEIAGAATLIALAGYGWQGNPDLAGQPTSPAAVPAN